MKIPKHWINKYQVDHVTEEYKEEEDDEAHDNLDGHHTPGLVLTVTPRTELVLLLLVEAEDGDHHRGAVAVEGGDAGVDVDASVGVAGVHDVHTQHLLRIRTFAATSGVHMIF